MKRTNQRGSALSMTLIAVVMLVGLSYGLLVITMSSNREAESYRDEVRALYVAESGLNEAYLDLSNGGTGALGDEKNPIEYAGFSYFVEATDQGGGVTSLVATAADGDQVARVELLVETAASGFFQFAAFGDEFLDLSSNSYTDSYDSSVGTYASQVDAGDPYAESNGHAGSNGNITLAANTAVYGNAQPGPASVVDDSASNTKITGSTAPAPSVVSMPPITVPVYASSGSMNVNGGSTVTISGDAHYDDITVRSNSKLVIVGPASVVLDSFVVRSNANVIIDASAGPVEFYGTGDFDLRSNSSIVSTGGYAADVSIQLTSDNINGSDTVAFNSNSQLVATVYAPSAHVTIESNLELFGAVSAQRMTLASNSSIHYDETLATANNGGQSSFDVVLWRELSEQQASAMP